MTGTCGDFGINTGFSAFTFCFPGDGATGSFAGFFFGGFSSTGALARGFRVDGFGLGFGFLPFSGAPPVGFRAPTCLGAA